MGVTYTPTERHFYRTPGAPSAGHLSVRPHLGQLPGLCQACAARGGDRTDGRLWR